MPDYSEDYKRLSQLKNDGLYRKAVALADSIAKNAEQHQAFADAVAATTISLGLAQHLEPNSAVVVIESLNEKITNASGWYKAALQSQLADFYYGQLQQEEWTIRDRTPIAGGSGDFLTWSVDEYNAKIDELHQAALSEESTKNISATQFHTIITGDTSLLHLKPTLFDLLAYRAIEYYSAPVNIAQPELSFSAELLLLQNEEFLRQQLLQNQPSYPDKAAAILQALTKFHLSNANEAALIFTTLQRFDLAQEYKPGRVFPALEQALKREIQGHNTHPEAALFFHNLAQYYYQLPEKEFPDALIKAVDICRQTTEKFPGSYGAAHCESLAFNIEAPSLDAGGESVISPENTLRINLSYKNLDSATVFLYPLNESDIKAMEKDRDIVGLVHRTKAVLFQKEIHLPGSEDHRPHSLETAITAQPVGNYLVVVDGGNCTSGFRVHTTNIAAIYSIQDSLFNYLVVDRQSGKPLPKVQVELLKKEYYNSKPKLLVSKVTGADGRVQFTTEESRGNLEIKMSLGDDVYTSTNYFYRNRRGNSGPEPTAHTYTDRAIYRPGQQIYFKSIIVGEDGTRPKLMPRHKVKAILLDDNYEELATLELLTNEFGSVQGSFNIPLSVLTGRLNLSINGKYHTVRVEEYKRPTYEVKFDAIKQEYTAGDSIRISGKALRYSGATVDGATVEYKIFASRFRYWYFAPPERVFLSSGQVETSQNGEFNFHFLAEQPFGPDHNFFLYEVEVTAVDQRGEVQISQTVVPVGSKPIVLHADVPDYLFSDSKESISIRSVNFSGEKVPAKVNVQVFEIPSEVNCLRTQERRKTEFTNFSKEESDRLFPHDPYKYSPDTVEVGREMASFILNTATDTTLSVNKLSHLPEGRYQIRVSLADTPNEEAITTTEFTLVKTNSKKAVSNLQFEVVPQTVSGKAGENAVIYLSSGCMEQPVLVEVEKSGKITSSKTYLLSGEKKRLEFEIKASDATDFVVHFVSAGLNRIYAKTISIDVLHPERNLLAQLKTRRDFMRPGEQESWTLTLENTTDAEVLASMYDASLDQFVLQNWNFDVFPNYYSVCNWSATREGYSYPYSQCEGPGRPAASMRNLPFLEGIAQELVYRIYEADISYDNALIKAEAAPVQRMEAESKNTADEETTSEKSQPPAVKPVIRKDFRETAFFYPQLYTNDSGNVEIKFTVPDALTTWKFRALAHTKTLQHTLLTRKIQSRKELMFTANAPRFFRAGDKLEFTAGLKNISEKNLEARVHLELYDPQTNKIITGNYGSINDRNITVEAGASLPVSWTLSIPHQPGVVGVRISASSGEHSDGEQYIVPVLPNRMLVLDTKPFVVTDTAKRIVFDSFKNTTSPTLQTEAYTLEFTANPVWYVVQALPYLMEEKYNSAEELFSRFYANSMGANILDHNPALKNTLESWKAASPEEFLSNLEKNQELKTILLSQTPWLLDAKDERISKQRIAQLLDLNQLQNEQSEVLRKLEEMQNPDGSFSWFSGMHPDFWMTNYIIGGFGHLAKAGALPEALDDDIEELLESAVNWTDTEIVRRYTRDLKDKDSSFVAPAPIYYLYARSFHRDIPISSETRKAIDYYLQRAEASWKNQSLMGQALLATVSMRFDSDGHKTIMNSLRDRAVRDAEKGMYWVQPDGFLWYQRPIASQAHLIEAFSEAGASQEEIDLMRTWLLLQKRTKHWGNTKATVLACYSVLMKGTDWLSKEQMPVITIGDKKLVYSPPGKNEEQIAANPGTGYFKKTWNAGEIKQNMAEVHIANPSGEPAWGAVYWQYFEDLDKIENHSGPLALKKDLFVKKVVNSKVQLIPISDETPVHQGDEVVVRLVVKTDEHMEYVHLEDMRASGFEPSQTLSQTHFQDGLVYYQSTKDVSTHFFISSLLPGTYVLEYSLKAEQKGTFSNGITTLQCLYAPEFSAHSKGIRVTIK